MYQPQIYRGLRSSIDWPLIICYVILLIAGWLNVYAASRGFDTGDLFSFDGKSGKQLLWMLISLGSAVFILFVLNPRYWEVLPIILYGLVGLLLVAVIFIGSDIKGSHSWFSLGPVSFQPAEVSKITTSLMLSLLMSQQNFRMSKLKDFLSVAAIVLIPMLVIVAEKETGSALVYIAFLFAFYREGFSGWFLVCVGMIVLLFILTLTVSQYVSILVLISIVSFCISAYEGRVKRWVIREVPLIAGWAFLPHFIHNPLFFLLIAVGVTIVSLLVYAYLKKKNHIYYGIAAVAIGMAMVFSTSFVFEKVLEDHQRSRIEVLLSMKDDPSGVGYNVTQSKIAIGSGGFFGKGFMQGTQTAFGFVPEQSTDFIFCTIGEEWGFVGCLFILAVYIFLILRILNDAERCRETFSRIYGYCVASILFMHVFINVGMTIGLMPVIGIPLPLMSYGGSSMLSFTLMIFIFLALYRQENKYF